MSNLVGLDLKTKADEPDQFKYVVFTHEQEQQWDKEMKVLQKQTTHAEWREIGNMRDRP